MKQFMQITTIAALILVATLSEAQTMRASDLDANTWAKVFNGQMQGVVIEFRRGDTLPVNFTAEGDFFETQRTQPSYLNIKKDFWMMVVKKDVLFSLDGTNYKPLPQVASGTLQVGTGADENGGRANFLNVNLSAFQK
ncbi:hypothetical protein [Bdellovibrio sp. HCB337]|uniref:hypothetical protein n=1 Tax=Bdellovibrio sp. HCB337 TaxID=3394358 RepID=UPI0039A45992